MKKRNIMMFSVLVLVVALIAGGTMAWFTAEAEPVTNLFEAGTVEIELHDVTLNENEEVTFPEEGISNVNPGDTFSKIVRVENVGTKTAYVRVKLTPLFTGFTGEGEPDYSLVEYPILNDWKLIEEPTGEFWYYYPDIVPADESTDNIIEEVIFAGSEMTNEYQGAGFTLTVEAQAIQTTNGAIQDAWGIDPNGWVIYVPEV